MVITSIFTLFFLYSIIVGLLYIIGKPIYKNTIKEKKLDLSEYEDLTKYPKDSVQYILKSQFNEQKKQSQKYYEKHGIFKWLFK